MGTGKRVVSKVVRDIRLAGGEVLNKRFVRHRTVKDVMDAIENASPKELKYRDEIKGSLLHNAAAMVDGLPVVMLLIKKGFDPNLVNNHGLKPVHYAKNSQIVLALIAYGAQIETSKESRVTSKT